ncbi:MAG: 2-C-methyl-D-erythritol 2,4-cyclodiphosphate synthase [Peptococcaceae bacterium]|nr:2-C-methyl-D-erythritol 2,4-cyclodiphosphate synthase [Peptococcaceae bacterium]
MRIGFGYDVHRLVSGRELILGGVKVNYSKGLLGHSDADVLIHAIMDSLLGAAGLGDIGRHFPDSDEEYRGISSTALIQRVATLLHGAGFAVGNIDATIVAQQPRLAPYIPEMEHCIATAISVSQGQINIKATTTEGLGFTGCGEGIAAYAVASIVETKVEQTVTPD